MEKIKKTVGETTCILHVEPTSVNISGFLRHKCYS